MQAQQIIDDVREQLLETSAAFWSDTQLLRYLNRGELDYVNKTRILEKDASVTLVQGRLDYPLPANWLSARAVFLKIVGEDGSIKWQRIYASNLEKTAQQNPNFLATTDSDQGQPHRYWIWGRTLMLNKAPSAQFATELHLYFKAKPIPLTQATDSINLDDSLSEGLTAYILWKAWSKEQEVDLASEQQQIYLTYIAEGRKWVKKEAGDERKRIDIDSPIPFEMSPNPFDPLAG